MGILLLVPDIADGRKVCQKAKLPVRVIWQLMYSYIDKIKMRGTGLSALYLKSLIKELKRISSCL